MKKVKLVCNSYIPTLFLRGGSILKISLIVAMEKNRVIGKENDMLWRIPKGWQYVQQTIRGQIVLGRKDLI